ncbi:alpha helicase, partial [bacterium]|nr:alpha helicase [bacterium]
MAALPELAAVIGITLDLKLASNGEKGPELQGPCPRCGGTDRFHIWPEQYPDRGGSYWCRGCGAGGDGIQFLRDFGKLSFKDACAAVGKKLDENYRKENRRQPWRSTPIPPPAPVTSAGMKPRECTEPETIWQKQAAKYVDQGCKALLENPAALA